MPSFANSEGGCYDGDCGDKIRQKITLKCNILTMHQAFLRTHYPYSETEVIMGTKLVRIAEISAELQKLVFISVYRENTFLR